MSFQDSHLLGFSRLHNGKAGPSSLLTSSWDEPAFNVIPGTVVVFVPTFTLMQEPEWNPHSSACKYRAREGTPLVTHQTRLCQ
jgi:hypothetical protein